MDIVKFVCFKVSRVSFLTEPECHEPILVSGSWNESINRICLWSYGTCSDPSDEPSLLSSHKHIGDIMDIKCSPVFGHVLVGSSTGGVTLYRPDCRADASPDDDSSKQLTQLGHWPGAGDLHPEAMSLLDRPCTSLALRNSGSAVLVGEEGRIICLALDREPSKRVDGDQANKCVMTSGQDCCAINGVDFVDHNCFATVNMMGQVKVWDLRNKLTKPERSILVSGDPEPLHCIRRHPGQPHLVATGGARGAALLWDLREVRYPVAKVGTQGDQVWAVEFHPSRPENLYLATETAGLLRVSAKLHDSSWTITSGQVKKLGMMSLLPTSYTLGVNCIALTSQLIVAGTDDEILYTLPCDLHY